MATGALLGGRCFASQGEALDAFYSGSNPAFTSGATSYLSEYVKVSGVWKIQRYSISSTGTVTTLTASNAPVITFPACDTATYFLDGMTIGWGIATAMILVAAVKFLERAK